MRVLNFYNLEVEQETIFDKYKELNMSSLAINGGNMFKYLFPNEVTKFVKTAGGSLEDISKADNLGL